MNTASLQHSLPDIEAVKSDIIDRLGHCPSFFLLAGETPEVVDSFWKQTQCAYLDNPIPSPFKEKLFAYLSRFCEVPYCVAWHAALLIGGDRPASDATWEPLSPEEVVALLQRPAPRSDELTGHLSTLATLVQPLDDWPASGSLIEESLIVCSIPLFLLDRAARRCQSELRRVLGPTWYDRLMSFLSYIRSAHYWAETHSELQLESEVEQLLREHPLLANWLKTYRQDVEHELSERLEAKHTQLKQDDESPRLPRSDLESQVTSQSGKLLRVHEDRKNTLDELEREKGLFEGVVRSIPDALLLANLDRHLVFCNRGVKEVFGYEPEELVGQPASVMYTDQEDHERQGQLRFRSDADEHYSPVEIMMRRKNGESFPAELVGTVLRTQQGEPLGFLGLIRDITQRKESEAEQSRYYRVLEALSTGTSLDELLGLVTQLAEEARPGMLGSILLLDETKQFLQFGYAASLPESYNAALDGLRIGNGVGSCGTAAYNGERVIVEDITKHPFWKDFRDLAEAAGLRACWSEPIRSPENEILGTLAMYFREPEAANEADLDLLRHTAQLAGIVIDRARTTERVKKSEERLSMALRATNDAIWDCDLINGTVWWNESYEKQFGRSADTADSWQWWIDRIHPDDQHRVVNSLKAFADGGGESDRWFSEYRFQRAHGSYAFITDRALRAYGDDGKPVRILGAMVDMTEHRALEKEVLDISAEEHRHIGNDLHDEIGQELTGLSMVADALITALSRKSMPEVRIAKKIGAGVTRTLGQVRSLVRGMNPVDVDAHGLMSSLSEMNHRLKEMYDVDCSFKCDEPVLLRDNQAATQLYRIAQEATTNAIRHARAKRIVVSLARNNGVPLLRVLDDGIGIEDDAATNAGMGLRIMGYRAGIVGGQLRIRSVDGGGTEITCTLPREALSN